MSGKGFYEPVRFNGFPEMKEAFASGYLPAAFLLAPLAMSLRQQGVPIKIVSLGHRDGTAIVVRKDSSIYSFQDLKGKTIAVPNRFSNQYLIVYKGLRDAGLSIQDVNIVELAPPDMPAALYTRSVDAITSGEPWMAKAEMEGYGRVLYQAKDIWPHFISCVLCVSDRAIQEHPEWVQKLVDGIAKSGKWLEGGMDHRMKAAQAVATHYYNQDPKLLRFVLSHPPDRVTYSDLALARTEFERMDTLAVQAGVLKAPVPFEAYADPRFTDRTRGLREYQWEPR